jgi:hypothetical protein
MKEQTSQHQAVANVEDGKQPRDGSKAETATHLPRQRMRLDIVVVFGRHQARVLECGFVLCAGKVHFCVCGGAVGYFLSFLSQHVFISVRLSIHCRRIEHGCTHQCCMVDTSAPRGRALVGRGCAGLHFRTPEYLDHTQQARAQERHVHTQHVASIQCGAIR